jgi:two-component system phosphate regulon response regulator PhoB
MSKTRILVVDDELPILEPLKYNLEKEGFEVSTAHDGREALQKCQSFAPDVVILDLMLPVMDGLAVCRQLRGNPRTQDIRILMLTAKGEETDEVVGFSMGADDYVSKPFRVRPLIERVKALLRRPAATDDAGGGDVIDAVGIHIDRVRHEVLIDGNELLLTPTEFKLLWTLMRQPGRTFSRNELLDCCRGEDANSMERTIDVHVRALRKKLDARADLIDTVRGIGYRFKPDR